MLNNLQCLCVSALLWVILSAITITIQVHGRKCRNGEYGVRHVLAKGLSRVTCINCTTLVNCPPGLGLSVSLACTGDVWPEDTDIHCASCILGETFSSTDDKKQCQACHSLSCHPNEAFTGKCTLQVDSTKCIGICKKGFYSNSLLDHCQPCSKCIGPDAKQVVKCIKDDMSTGAGLKCEFNKSLVPTVIATTNGNRGPPSATNTDKRNGISNGNCIIKSNGTEKQKQQQQEKHYEVYGHPALLAFLLVIILVLGILVVLGWKGKCWKKRSRSTTQYQDVHYTSTDFNGNLCANGNVMTQQNAVDAEANQSTTTSSAENTSTNGNVLVDINGPDTSMTSTTEEQASSSAENNSANGPLLVDIGEENMPTMSTIEEQTCSSADNTCSNGNVCATNDKPTSSNLQTTSPIRKRTSSSSSGKRISGILRQLSNPGAGSKQEKSIPKSKTFSHFPRKYSGPKGTRSEEVLLLARDSGTDSDDGSATSSANYRRDSLKGSEKKKRTDITIGQLNAETCSDVCRMLNRKLDGKDWRQLAGEMGYNNDDVKDFEREANPAYVLLSDWKTKSGNNVMKLIKLLRKMGRDDIADLLESES